MDESNHQLMLAALERTDAYPWPAHDVTPISTHISHVFLAGNRVIKLKRPVQYSFVDYSTLEKRHQACLDEVRLNRLLSDDIYLGVVPIIREGDSFRVGSAGDEPDAVEWATLMRRIDDDEVLDGRLARGDVPDGLAERLAERLVPFHMEMAPECAGNPVDTMQTQNQVVLENLDELRPFVGVAMPEYEFGTIDRVMRSFVDEYRALLESRVARGWIREGHGDMRCEHVVVPDEGPIQLFDCVEFNRDLRCADIASDLAFLLMDLFRLGADPDQVQTLLDRYDEAGAELPVGLLRFYWVHRALVRAKVQCLRLEGATNDDRLRIVSRVMDFLHVAMRQAISPRSAVIAMTGLSGTGKSTVARSLARATGATFLDTDIIRKHSSYLAGDEAKARGEDIYTAEWTTRTYDRMIGEGNEIAQRGGVAILDGTFLDRRLRDQAASAARDLDVPFILVEVTCDEDVVRRRLESRMRDPRRTSDADVAIHMRQRERFEAIPPGIPEGTIHVTVDTSEDGPVSLDDVLRALVDAGTVIPGIREVADSGNT